MLCSLVLFVVPVSHIHETIFKNSDIGMRKTKQWAGGREYVVPIKIPSYTWAGTEK